MALCAYGRGALTSSPVTAKSRVRERWGAGVVSIRLFVVPKCDK